MGDRANCFVVNDRDEQTKTLVGVYLYTHWEGTELPKTVARALASDAGRGRAQDDSYLARIIFDHMLGYYDGHSPEETGFGVSAVLGDNEHPIVVVDPGSQRVRLAAEGTERQSDAKGWVSYEDFITANLVKA